MASIKKRATAKGVTWRARYRDSDGKMHERRFDTHRQAREWANEQETRVVKGTHVDPRLEKTTLAQWCDEWLEGYGGRESTRRQARTHVSLIKSGLGQKQLVKIRPHDVAKWLRTLEAEGRAPSYISAVHRRLRHILRAAIRNGLLHSNPAELSRGEGAHVEKRLPALATADQVWALHDALPEHLRLTVLLGAFAGLRSAEVCGLRVEDVDTSAGIVFPKVQYPAVSLKSAASRAPVPIPEPMARRLRVHLDKATGSRFVFVNQWGEQLHPRVLEREFRAAKRAVIAAEASDEVPQPQQLPAGFRFHDCRHFYASFLIAGGADVKVVQARMRHANATLTLNTYAHLWPDSDDSTRALVGEAFAGREGPDLRAV